MAEYVVSWKDRALAAESELARVNALLDTPEQDNFLKAVDDEIKYQRIRWDKADAEKTDSDWFWLVGYLVSKAMHDVRGKRLHHLTAAAAVLANWHAAGIKRGENMPEERGDQKDHTGRKVD